MADLSQVKSSRGSTGVRGRASRSCEQRPRRLVRHLKGVLRSDGHGDENEPGPAPLPTRRICPTASRAPGRGLPNSYLGTHTSGRCRTD